MKKYTLVEIILLIVGFSTLIHSTVLSIQGQDWFQHGLIAVISLGFYNLSVQKRNAEQ